MADSPPFLYFHTGRNNKGAVVGVRMADRSAGSLNIERCAVVAVIPFHRPAKPYQPRRLATGHGE